MQEQKLNICLKQITDVIAVADMLLHGYKIQMENVICMSKRYMSNVYDDSSMISCAS